MACTQNGHTNFNITHCGWGGGGAKAPSAPPPFNEVSVRGNAADEGVIKVHPTPKNRFTAV